MRKPIIITFVLTLLFMTALVPYSDANTVKASSIADEVVSIGHEYLGVPYRFGGTTPSGFDCSGFTGYVFNKVGIVLPRTTSEQYTVGARVNRSDLKKGDLVFFETYRSGPSHNGIYIGEGRFIHSSSSNGVSISRVNDPHYWGPRYIGARRVIEDRVQAVQALPVLPPGQFHDVSTDHWAHSSITTLSAAGIINGFSDSFFRPGDTITRAQAATILARALDLPMDDQTINFTDVSRNHSALTPINAVHNAGLFNGNSRGEFRPSDPITREHIAIVFTRAFDLGYSLDSSIQFADINESHRNYISIQALAESGITTGFSDGTFRPSNRTTRAQFSEFIHRALD